MEKHLKLIWGKIDHQLSTKELSLFDTLLQSDDSFSKLYNEQLSLSSNLRKVPTVNAPSNLLDNIMKKVVLSKKSYASTHSSFSGIKVIALGFLLLIILAFILTASFTIDLNLESSFPSLINWFNGVSMPAVLVDMQKHSIYFLVLLPVISLVWMDNLYGKSLEVIKKSS